MIEVRYQRGLHLPEIDLWLDPQVVRPRAFVSHAHADHFARHQSVICSETTELLLKSRYGIAKCRVEAVAFHQTIVRDGFRLRLLPAGHICGSAMLHVTRLSDNASLLYTGDFKMRPGRTTEAISLLAADTLIIETTFGLPAYVFPGTMEVEAQVLRFVQDAFDDGDTPVLLAYSLGKAQEALALLTENNIPALLHPAAAAMTDACRAAGVDCLPEPVVFEGHAPAGHVVIAPPHAVRTRLFRGLRSMRVAMLSGWAMEPGAAFRYRADRMIPFSDHADHPGLMECIRRVRPRRVLTVHGFAREFAAELRQSGTDAWAAEGGDQLDLPIPAGPRRGTVMRGPRLMRPMCAFADFSDVCRLVGETGSRVAKQRFLTSYLKGLADADDAMRALDLFDLGCRCGPGKSRTCLDAAGIRRVLTSLRDSCGGRCAQIERARGPVIGQVRTVLLDLPVSPEAVDLAAISGFVAEIADQWGSLEALDRLGSRLMALHPVEGETLLRILHGDLGNGIDAPLLAEVASQCPGTAGGWSPRSRNEAGVFPEWEVSNAEAEGSPELPLDSADGFPPGT